MEVYVVLHGRADKPELSDEIVGYLYDAISAARYCEKANETADEGYAYWYEAAEQLEA